MSKEVQPATQAEVLEAIREHARIIREKGAAFPRILAKWEIAVEERDIEKMELIMQLFHNVDLNIPWGMLVIYGNMINTSDLY